MDEKEKVLIVDDEYIIAIDIKQRLEAIGYEVTGIVNSGEKAIALCEKEKPSIVLMDIIIKGQMDGIEASDIIQERFNIPVVFITASSDTLTLKKIMEKGSYGYIHKPITDVDLKYTLQQSIKMYNTCRDLVSRKKAAEFLFETVSSAISQYQFPAFIVNGNNRITAQSAFFADEKFENINRILNKTGVKNEDRTRIITLLASAKLPARIQTGNNTVCSIIPLDSSIYIEIKENCE
ncbi:MAG: response regulator [Spirochaetales bacterium]|nr:response regulator [Spirochaetales bacterium]